MVQDMLFSSISINELENRIVNRLITELGAVSTNSNPTPQADDLITAKQVSKLLGVSLVSIHKWKKDGKLKFYRFGTRIRFKKSEVLQTDKDKSSKRANFQ